MNQDQLKVKVSFDDEPTQDVLAALQEVGAADVEELEQHGVLGIGTVILAILVGNAFYRLVASLLRLWKCGVIVDARGSRVVVKKDCDLPPGSVLIIKLDGTKVTLNEPSAPQIEVGVGGLVGGQNIGR
ncbi:hypothetical protein [Nostoc sp. UIC 10630]|uniref:hypothetical protein n=1 Tax=Nostoc sp. UIC 10630 TaxID=2100146 RepID=UPI0013CFBEA7|nr:hypothetical protein [Nostoc sp. UIC 10630]NEU77626.1 hypothetical protein [Nostoc sp. UIC 10630]